MFTRVDYKLAPIPQEAVWEGVLQADSQWCYADEGSYKMKLREVKTKYEHKAAQAKKLQKWILENFEESKMYAKFTDAVKSGAGIVSELESEEIDELFDKLLTKEA